MCMYMYLYMNICTACCTIAPMNVCTVHTACCTVALTIGVMKQVLDGCLRSVEEECGNGAVFSLSTEQLCTATQEQVEGPQGMQKEGKANTEKGSITYRKPSVS